MFFTVAICSHNNGAVLDKSLASLVNLKCGLEDDYEILVINNASTDRTEEVITSYLPRLSPRLRSVFEPELGLSSARNRALRDARGEIVAFLDDDVVVDSDWLIAVSETFSSYSADVVGGRSYLIYPCEKPVWFYNGLENFLSKLDYGNVPLDNTTKELFGLNFSVRKRLAMEVGGFNPTLGRRGKLLLSGEEKDFQKRVLAHGGKCVYQPEAIVGHMVSLERMRKDWFLKRIFFQALSGGFDDDRESLSQSLLMLIRCSMGLLKSLILRDCSPPRWFLKQMILVAYAGNIFAVLVNLPVSLKGIIMPRKKR